jgi:class 3 adenylate cyclase/CheY-like chemotaxis protein
MDKQAQTILVVDDTPQNVTLLEDLLSSKGYRILTANCGREGLRAVRESSPDLVLLDILMPDITGYEVCRQIRGMEGHELTPIVMTTALDGKEERVKGIEAGADDFLTKPISIHELTARVRSLLRISQLHRKVRTQAKELESFNRELEKKVRDQLQKLERANELKRFLPPQLAAKAMGDNHREFQELLKPHRREIVVVFADLTGFTAFTRSREPEEMMRMLKEFNRAMGELVWKHEGTLDRFTGDGMMVFFNDPVEVPDPASRALRMTLDMRESFDRLRGEWTTRGYELGCRYGVASGNATLGVVGFEKRWDYTAMGTVTNLSARLCSQAKDTEILLTKSLVASVSDEFDSEDRGEVQFKGEPEPIGVVNLLSRYGNRESRNERERF